MKILSKALVCLAFFSFHLTSAQDFPVDHVTGRVLINLPLVEVNDRNLSHTIGLAYDATGVKVDANSGLVGVNWILMGGGEVVRELRGIPDDFYSTLISGWLFDGNAASIGNYVIPVDGATLNCDNESSHYTYLNSLINRDTEPDLFRFSAGSISGTFMFDNTGNISNLSIVPYQDIKIVPYRPTSNSPISKFTISTADGTKYTFGGSSTFLESNFQKAEKEAGAPDPFYFRTNFHRNKNDYPSNLNTAWKLAMIESPAGEKILFEYEPHNINTGGTVMYGLVSSTDGIQPPTTVAYRTFDLSKVLILKRVKSPHQTVNLTTEGIDEALKLLNIQISDVTPTSSSLVKQIHFAYSGSARRFLKQFQISDGCNSYLPYTFQYDNSGILPAQGSNKQDIWGYYLSTAQHKFPKLYIYPDLSGIKRISLYPISGQTNEIIIPGANRVSNDTSPVGTLTKISFPTGASTTFQYEPNEFRNPINGALSKGAGLRIARVEIHDGISTSNNIVKQYKYWDTEGVTSGKLIAMPTFWQLSGCYKSGTTNAVDYAALSSLPAAEQWSKLIIRTGQNLASDFDALPSVMYEYVTETIGLNQGRIVYQFDIPYVYGSNSSGDWNPTFVHIARQKVNNFCPSTGLNLPSFYQHPFPSQTPNQHLRGVILSKRVFGQNDLINPEVETLYQYQEKSIAGSSIKGLQFEYIPINNTAYYFMYGRYNINGNKDKVLLSITERTKSRTNAAYLEKITNFQYPTNHFKPSIITTTNSDGTLITKRFKYVKDYGPPQASDANTPLQVRMLDALYNGDQTGHIVEQTTSYQPVGASEKTVQGSLLMFNTFRWSTTMPLNIQPMETYDLRTDGIAGFAMSSISGTGATRIFNRDAAYKKNGTYTYHSFGDLVQVENEQRQLSALHTDSLTGLITARIKNAAAREILYSNFDQDTRFDFDYSSGFSAADKTMPGKASRFGLGWAPMFETLIPQQRFLTKIFTKKPSARYKFSAWYKCPVVNGTHSLSISIKNLSGTTLLTVPLNYTLSAPDQWVYNEVVVDLSTIADPKVNVEIYFTGNYVASNGQLSTVDDVLFAPEGADVIRASYTTPFGISATTAPDGKMTSQEFFANGDLRFIRDHDGNIIQASQVETFLPEGATNVPIDIIVMPEITEGQLTSFEASTSCLDFSTLQWKITPVTNPGGGTFANGPAVYPYTFALPGDYIVTLKLSHASYGSYEIQKTITVIPAPLNVNICVQQGALNIDLCNPLLTRQEESCSGTTGPVSPGATTFSATASGCPVGTTYTYTWKTRGFGDSNSEWATVGTGATKTITNASSYQVKCTASACSKTGDSNTKAVIVTTSSSSCEVPEN